MGRRLSSAVLVGRDKELGRLRDASHSREGGPTMIIVRGEAGVGKTRLVEEFAAEARATGARLITGGCVVLGGDHLPYAPLIEALRPLAHAADLEVQVPPEVGQLIPGMGQANDAPAVTDQALLFELILGFLEALAAERPLVFVLEDLHWADPSTLQLLPFLIRNLTPGRVLVVCTVRDDDVQRGHPIWPLLVELQRHARVEQLELRPLGADDVAAQLTHLLERAPSPELVRRVAERSGGNPFFVEELVATDPTAETLPVTIRDLFAQRLDTVPPAAVPIVGTIAVAGGQAQHTLLAAATGLSDREIVEALRRCVAAGILIIDSQSDAYRFRHALMAEAVVNGLLPGERAELHRSVADAVEATLSADDPAAVAVIAQHRYAANDLGKALGAAVRAGAAAEQMAAHLGALQHYERALALWAQVSDAEGVTGLDHPALLERAAVAAGVAGELPRAVELLEAAIAAVGESRQPVRAALLYEKMGTYLRHGLHGDEALMASQRAVDLVPAEPASEARAEVLAGYGGSLMLTDRLTESRRICEQAVEVARQVGALRAEARALYALGPALVVLEGYAAAAVAFERSLVLGEELGDLRSIGGGYVNLTWALTVALRLEEAVAVGGRGIDRLVVLGMARTAGPALIANTASALLRLGRWEECQARLDQGFAFRPVEAAESILLIEQLNLYVWKGDQAPARELADRLTSSLEDARAWPEGWALVKIARAGLALLDGEPDAAVREAELDETLTGLDDPQFALQMAALSLRAHGDLVDCGAEPRAGGAAEVLDIARRAGQRARGESELFLAMCEAEWTRVEGKSDSDQWLAIAARWDEVAVPWFASYARLRGAQAIVAARGDVDEAMDILAQALKIAESLGARFLADQARASAKKGGLDVGVHATVPQPNPFGLTAREAEVLALVAEGRSNPQIADALFISRKTASTHVSKILMKLRVSTRGEAAAVARRLGPGD